MDRPKDLPNRLECPYCERYMIKGGECKGKGTRDEIGCLFFKMDKRGCIRKTDLKLPIKLFENISPIGMWDDRWTLHDTDTEIKIIKIYHMTWDKQSGYLYIHATCEYYINEFNQEYKENLNKPSLKIIK